MKKYTRTEFSKIIHVDRHTLAKWDKIGKLVPNKDDTGKKYYTDKHIVDYKNSFSDTEIRNGEGVVDLRNVPRDIRGGFAWKQAAKNHSSVRYSYKNVEGELIILEYTNRVLTVDINGEEKRIGATDLGKARIGKLTGVVSYEYKYSVGETIKKGTTDITILEQIKSKNWKAKAYRYKCNICGQIREINEGNISDKGCCPVCKGIDVVKGINDIATTDKWMVPYFQNATDAKKYYHGNRTAKIYFKCPDCGRVKNKPMFIDTLYRNRSIGCNCGDGVRYPNKFMYSVCEQLLSAGTISYFEDEYSPNWIGKKRFDFYIEINNNCEKLIVEMDGGFHFGKSRDKNITPEELKKIDEWKDLKAQEHGINVIRINATVSEKTFISENIINALIKYISLDGVDWEKADKFAISNFAKQVCIYYSNNKELTIAELAKVFHIAPSTARRYVHKGEVVGWCEYNYELLYKNKYEYARQEAKEKAVREKAVCEYYDKHAPIEAKEIAKIFKIHHATALKYLNNCEKYGFKPYDKNYTKEINISKLKKTKKDSLKKSVLCFSLDGKLLKKYESVTDAALDNNVSPTAISNCCKTKGTSSGKIFRYENE